MFEFQMEIDFMIFIYHESFKIVLEEKNFEELN